MFDNRYVNNKETDFSDVPDNIWLGSHYWSSGWRKGLGFQWLRTPNAKRLKVRGTVWNETLVSRRAHQLVATVGQFHIVDAPILSQTSGIHVRDVTTELNRLVSVGVLDIGVQVTHLTSDVFNRRRYKGLNLEPETVFEAIPALYRLARTHPDDTGRRPSSGLSMCCERWLKDLGDRNVWQQVTSGFRLSSGPPGDYHNILCFELAARLVSSHHPKIGAVLGEASSGAHQLIRPGVVSENQYGANRLSRGDMTLVRADGWRIVIDVLRTTNSLEQKVGLWGKLLGSYPPETLGFSLVFVDARTRNHLNRPSATILKKFGDLKNRAGYLTNHEWVTRNMFIVNWGEWFDWTSKPRSNDLTVWSPTVDGEATPTPLLDPEKVGQGFDLHLFAVLDQLPGVLTSDRARKTGQMMI